LVRSSDIGSSQHRPSTVIPERGQVGEDSVESPNNDGWAVFQPEEVGSNLATDPCHFRPESASVAVDSCAFACNADVLAGKTASQDVSVSAVGSTIESSHVGEDGELWEASVALAREQDFLAVRVDFDGADAAMPEQLSSKDSAARSCEEMQLIHLPRSRSFPWSVEEEP
jgi:hypothetical protein